MTDCQLVVYSRDGCGLCEAMEAALLREQDRFSFSWERVDVDTSHELYERYNDKVPVLADESGREICRYFLDTGALTRYFAGV